MKSRKDYTELKAKGKLIPSLAQEAFHEAYKTAIASGQTVTVVRGTSIIETNSKGIIKVVGEVRPGKKVTPGKSGFKIR